MSRILNKIKREQELRETSIIEQSRQRTIERLFATMRELLQKTKLALLLPIIVENYKEFKKCLSGTEYEFISQLIKEFRVDKEKKTDYGVSKYIGKEVDKIIETILINPEILNYVPEAWFKELPPKELKLLKCLEDTFEIVQIRFPRKAFVELEIGRGMYKTYHKNEDMIAETTYLEQKLYNRRTTVLWKNIARQAVLHHLESKLDTRVTTFETSSQTEIYSIMEEVKRTQHLHSNRERDSEEQFKFAKNAYGNKLSNDLKEEKAARAQYNKLTIQLESLIKKYDQMMLDKFSEDILLSEMYAKCTKGMPELQKEFKRVKALHYELVVKKCGDFFTPRVDVFKIIRSVAVIQRWYKKMLSERNKAREKKIPMQKSTMMKRTINASENKPNVTGAIYDPAIAFKRSKLKKKKF